MALAMNSYEKSFENIQDRAIVISELIEELIKIEEMLTVHRANNSKGIQYEQFVERKREYTDQLNRYLQPHKMKFISSEAA